MTTIDEIVEVCEGQRSVFRAFYPKVYEQADRYTPTKKLSALLMYTAQAVSWTPDPNELPGAFPVCYRPICDMVEHEMPMFFVKPELAAAALRTDYPDEVDFTELPLPFEAGIFVLPKKTLVHPIHGDCSWIGWGRFRGTKDYGISAVSPRTFAGGPDGMAIFSAALFDEEVPWFHFAVVDDGEDGKRFRIPDALVDTPMTDHPAPLDSAMVASDEEFVQRMVKLAFNLLLIGEARPELSRPGAMQKRVVKKDRANEFWSPHVWGLDFQVRRAAAAGGDTVTVGQRRSHWVRGHMRNQACGEGLRRRRRIWIEPYWVDFGMA